jgi:hypothetical protein
MVPLPVRARVRMGGGTPWTSSGIGDARRPQCLHHFGTGLEDQLAILQATEKEVSVFIQGTSQGHGIVRPPRGIRQRSEVRAAWG